MKKFELFALSLIAVPALAWSADALPPVPPATSNCSNIVWSPAFLKDYPKAPVTCQSVTVKDGINYARFNGKVAKIGTNFVQVQLSDMGGIPVSTIAFQIGVGGRITMGDTVETVKELKIGDVLTFWVRERQFGFLPTLTDKPMTVVKPDAMSVQ
jgi:hypothetical protein